MILFVITTIMAPLQELFKKHDISGLLHFNNIDFFSVIASTQFNPLAMVANLMEDWNSVLPNFYYVRPEATAPASWWKTIFGFVFNVYWKQLIWTWEPFDAYFKYNAQSVESAGAAGVSWATFF